jgi:hypothetical protein
VWAISPNVTLGEYLLKPRKDRFGLDKTHFRAYMNFNSGALGSKPNTLPKRCRGPLARFFVSGQRR